MGQAAHLMFKKRAQEGMGFVKLLSNGEEVEVPLEHVTLTAIIDTKDE
jgi:hypothetical protein